MVDLLKLFSLQNDLNGYKHITDFYFEGLGEHLWRKFQDSYNGNLLSFYNYLDLKNRENFKHMVFEEFQIEL